MTVPFKFNDYILKFQFHIQIRFTEKPIINNSSAKFTVCVPQTVFKVKEKHLYFSLWTMKKQENF